MYPRYYHQLDLQKGLKPNQGSLGLPTINVVAGRSMLVSMLFGD